MHNQSVSRSATRPSVVAAAAALTLLAALAFLMLRPSAGQAAPAKDPVVSTAKTSLGQILVDSRGRTLYMFDKDEHGKSACNGKCASFWPPLIAAAKPRAAGGAKASLLGTTKRADGRLQVTYHGHPVYTFVKDTKKGQTNGEELNAFGAEWYALSSAGNEVHKKGSSKGGY